MAEFVRAAVAVIQMQHGLTKKWVIHTLTPLIASLRGGDHLVGREAKSIWRTHQMFNWPVISLNATVFHIAYENRNKIPIKLLIQQILKILHSLDVFKYKFKFMEIADGGGVQAF